MKRAQRWTSDEKRWLAELIKAGIPLPSIADKLERSLDAVRAKACKLGHYPEDWGGRSQ